jgi:hypothetical protein
MAMPESIRMLLTATLMSIRGLINPLPRPATNPFVVISSNRDKYEHFGDDGA